GDFNGDGLDDLLLYGPSGEVDLFYGQATDGLRAEPGQHDQWRAGHTLKIADFNGDGYSDVLIYAADGATEIRYGQMNGGLRF
ncbi:FG-GAP repeat domain-containing protein, partial [Enterobacter hormaechei]